VFFDNEILVAVKKLKAALYTILCCICLKKEVADTIVVVRLVPMYTPLGSCKDISLEHLKVRNK